MAGTGVHVTALCPGLTPTEFQSVSSPSNYQERYPAMLWTDVDLVAVTGLRDVVRGRALSVPGPLYKAMAGTSAVTPRWVLRRAARGVRRA